MAKDEKPRSGWETYATIATMAGLWFLGFERKWFGFGPWTKEFPAWYPPPQNQFLIGVILTGLGLGWSFSSIRYSSVISKAIGWIGFLYFYFHVITLGYMADPDLFIWKIFARS